MSATNQAWNLESFVDALVVELDKTRETLSVKAINRPLSYTVKDMAMDLQIFPTYDGRAIQFVTAQPGEQGASKVSIQLSAITDRQVRESSKRPTTKGDIKLAEIGLERDIEEGLRKIGVSSVGDLRRIEEKDVNLAGVVKQPISYSDLAQRIRGAKRAKHPPRVLAASLVQEPDGEEHLELTGQDLAIDPTFEPVVVLNGELVPLLSFEAGHMRFACPRTLVREGPNEVVLVLDPHSVVRVQVQHPRSQE